MEKNWSEFTRRIAIKASKETIFNFCSIQDNLEKWFLSKADFISASGTPRARDVMVQPADTYSWMWHGSENNETGEILENNNTDYLKFTFLGCVVSMKVIVEAGGNIIEVKQENIPLDEESKMNYYVECTRGWTFYLANLKSILEGGIDLRNKNMEVKQVINS